MAETGKMQTIRTGAMTLIYPKNNIQQKTAKPQCFNVWRACVII